MNKDILSAQAASLRSALAKTGITLRHTNCLDLVYASHGLRSRETITGTTALSPVPSGLLEEKAARILAGKPTWIPEAIRITKTITHAATDAPQRTTAASGIPLTVEGLRESPYLLGLALSLSRTISSRNTSGTGRDRLDKDACNRLLSNSLNRYRNNRMSIRDALAKEIDVEDFRKSWEESEAPSPREVVMRISVELADQNEKDAAVDYLRNARKAAQIVLEKTEEVEGIGSVDDPADSITNMDIAGLAIVLGYTAGSDEEFPRLTCDDDGLLIPDVTAANALNSLGLNIHDCPRDMISPDTEIATATNARQQTALISYAQLRTLIEENGSEGFTLMLRASVMLKSMITLTEEAAIGLNRVLVTAHDDYASEISEIMTDGPVILTLDSSIRLHSDLDFDIDPALISSYSRHSTRTDIQSAWPPATPRPVSKKTQALAAKVTATEDLSEDRVQDFLTSLADDCRQTPDFWSSLSEKDHETVTIGTGIWDKPGFKKLNAAMCSWFDPCEKIKAMNRKGWASTPRDQSFQISKESLLILAETIKKAETSIF